MVDQRAMATDAVVPAFAPRHSSAGSSCAASSAVTSAARRRAGARRGSTCTRFVPIRCSLCGSVRLEPAETLPRARDRTVFAADEARVAEAVEFGEQEGVFNSPEPGSCVSGTLAI